MKKFLTVMMSLVMLLSLVNYDVSADKTEMTTPAAETSTAGVFDEAFVNASFGVITDTHLDKAASAYETGDYRQPYTREAFQQIIKQAAVHDADGVDGIVITGDIIDNQVNDNNKFGRDRRGVAEVNAFMDVVLEFTDSEITIDGAKYPNNIGNNVMLTTGNHDTRSYYSSFASFKDLMGDEYFETNGNRTDVRVDLEKGYRHSYITINGQEYHFIVLEPLARIPWLVDPLVLDYIEADLEAVTTANPDAYVFVSIHQAPFDTIYGSEDDWDVGSNKWHTDALTVDFEDAIHAGSNASISNSKTAYADPQDVTYIGMDGKEKTTKGHVYSDGSIGSTRNIIGKYPQVMVFSGHTHLTLNDERCIVSVNEENRKFTAVNAGGVVSGIGSGFGYEATNTYSYEATDSRKGLLVQVDVDGDVRITRLNFAGKTLTKEPWELSKPAEDNSHLDKYTRATRTENNTAPVLSGEITLENGSYKNVLDTADKTAYNVKISLPAATDANDYFVVYYKIEAYAEGAAEVKKSWNVRSDFTVASFDGFESNIRETFTQFLELDAGTYDFKVTAYDSWGAASDVLTYSGFTVS